MQNYKVEVKNHSEGMEAQDLFLKMGFRKGVCIDSRYPKLIVTDNYDDDWYSAGAMIYYSKECKQITLQELRAMVAPKQKEYLVKTDTGYTLQVLSDVVDGHDGIIEVPEDAEILTACGLALYFWNKTNNTTWVDGEGWVSCDDERLCTLKSYLSDKDVKIVWQRESLNDQVASAEEYRKSFTHTPKSTLDVINNMQDAFEKAQSAINAQNAMAELFTYPQYLSSAVHGKEFIVKPNQKKYESKLVDDGQKIIDGFTQPEELPFISDTQATLNERQAQYGNFSEVAEMTQQLLTVMGQYGYEYLPDMHKEALHMICSKMARIVNGDNNHLDSWHDIGGYAKLIENNIK